MLPLLVLQNLEVTQSFDQIASCDSVQDRSPVCSSIGSVRPSDRYI